VPGREGFQYAVLRVVPRIERGEFLNAGVVLFCRRRRFLAARTILDTAALHALAPASDGAEIRALLETIEKVAAGDPAAGPIAALDQSERFHWLTSPSSTIVQPSAVHTGLTAEPERELEHLFAALVARGGA